MPSRCWEDRLLTMPETRYRAVARVKNESLVLGLLCLLLWQHRSSQIEPLVGDSWKDFIAFGS